MNEISHQDHPQKPLTVRDDAGGWISGPCVTIEDAEAGSVRPGEVLLLDDGTIAVITRVTHGVYFLPGGHQHGVAADWAERGGTATGTLIRGTTDVLQRVTGGAS